MEISKTLSRASFWSDYEGYMLNLFKSCSNLGFDQDSNGQNLKNEKSRHIVFLCHIVRIQLS